MKQDIILCTLYFTQNLDFMQVFFVHIDTFDSMKHEDMMAYIAAGCTVERGSRCFKHWTESQLFPII